jgi:hypothetical protein
VPSEDTNLDALVRGATKSAGDRYTFVVERLPATIFELQEQSFSSNGSVLLPVPLLPVVDGVVTVSALEAVAAALAHAPSGQRLIATGHAAGTGSAAGDLELSELRARNAELYLRGDRSGWAVACDAHQSADAVHLLTWASYAHGYACDPGPPPHPLGLASALARFREAYNAEFGTSLEPAGPLRTPDWEAFYDLYDKSLAALLGVEVSALAGKRSAVTWLDPPMLGCAGHWPAPIERQTKGAHRVELMFIEPGTLPDLKNEQPPGAALHGARSLLKRSYTPLQSELRPLKLVLLDGMREPFAGKAYRLVVTDTHTFEGTTGGDGDLEHSIPAHCTFGELTLFLDAEKRETLVWRLLIGQLPPVERMPGLQARLNLLGVHSGHPGMGETAHLEQGITTYQHGRNDLTPSGEPDDDTRRTADDEYTALA